MYHPPPMSDRVKLVDFSTDGIFQHAFYVFYPCLLILDTTYIVLDISALTLSDIALAGYAQAWCGAWGYGSTFFVWNSRWQLSPCKLQGLQYCEAASACDDVSWCLMPHLVTQPWLGLQPHHTSSQKSASTGTHCSFCPHFSRHHRVS